MEYDKKSERLVAVWEPVTAVTVRQHCDPLDLLGPEQTAALIGCTVEHLYRIPHYKLPRYQIGRESRFFRRDVLLFLVTYGRARSPVASVKDSSETANGESVADAVKRLRGGVRERSQTQRRTQ